MCVCVCMKEKDGSKRESRVKQKEKREKCIPLTRTHRSVVRIISNTSQRGVVIRIFCFIVGVHKYIQYTYIHTIYISSIVLLYSHSWRIRHGTGPCRGWIHYIITYIRRYTRAGLYAGNIFRYGRLTFTAPAGHRPTAHDRLLSVLDVFMSFAYILYDDDDDVYIYICIFLWHTHIIYTQSFCRRGGGKAFFSTLPFIFSPRFYSAAVNSVRIY